MLGAPPQQCHPTQLHGARWASAVPCSITEPDGIADGTSSPLGSGAGGARAMGTGSWTEGVHIGWGWDGLLHPQPQKGLRCERGTL